MMTGRGWFNFVRRIMPDLISLARDLYQRHDADPAKAREEISEIRDHGARLDQERERVDRELEEMRKREQS